ncbi:hypothetical protein [Lentilactobacillus sunkii]|jgi:hypothetical protein|uniref:Uncharacterized protein n=1 Tax=Lentilactobacillus sunkii DSM 19904 TaxID=1423808 RepID=A0A0R1L7S3_9LACO|nr:hypothetical protein [Lentilactobacillus sunkii]KRK87575.1 hypothetical protein FD17_GL000974 [Lentilactobacillus sunkii DSM 19904]
MRDLMITPSGDTVQDELTHDLTEVSGTDELMQSSAELLGIEQGEMDELAPDCGLPLDNILGKAYDDNYAAQDISNTLMNQEPRIDAVDGIQITHDLSQRRSTIAVNIHSSQIQDSGNQYDDQGNLKMTVGENSGI